MSFSKRNFPPINAMLALESFDRTGNVTATADELSLTQSAVSRQLQNLEDHIGISLFIREKKRIMSTHATREYAKEIRIALNKMSAATLKLKVNPSGGSLNLAIQPAFGVRWLAPRLVDFAEKHPEVTVNLSTRLTQFDFSAESFDAAVHFGKRDWPNVNYLELMTEFVVPVASPDLLDKTKILNPGDVLEQSLLHLETRSTAWEKWAKHCNIAFDSATGMLFDQFANMTQAAIHGMGFALMPEYLIQKELQEGQLKIAVDMPRMSIGNYYLVWPKNKQTYIPNVVFRKWLEGVLT